MARYDARQLHCLKTLGLVPWVLREDSVPDTLSEAATVVHPSLTLAASESTDGFPDDQSALASCLARYRVCVVPRQGVSTSESAMKGRIILLLESRHTMGASEPIDGHVWDLDKDEEQLLLAMLRSIGLAENDLCRVVPARTGDAPEPLNVSVSIAELNRQLPRLLLVLMNRFDDSLAAENHRLEGDAGVTGWRLPHPALLLVNPERKRGAWEVLKRVRQMIFPG